VLVLILQVYGAIPLSWLTGLLLLVVRDRGRRDREVREDGFTPDFMKSKEC
jgi:hypothetical protein